MARNIEIKARIDNIEALESKVAKIADNGPTEIVQDDTFFHCEAGRLKLRVFSEKHGELIFYRRANQAGPKESFYVRSQTDEPEALRETLSLAYGEELAVFENIARCILLTGLVYISIEWRALGTFLNSKW